MERYQKVQIQTIDACNSRCVRCPNKDLTRSFKKMEDWLFMRILSQLRELRTNFFYSIDFFLENEPLLDDKLFERIKIARMLLPKMQIQIITNGIMVPKWEKQIMKSLVPDKDIIIMNIHTEDVESFNASHQTNLTEEHFRKMNESAKRIQDKLGDYTGRINIAFTKEDTVGEAKDWYTGSYSRGGYLNGGKKLTDTINGCLGNKQYFFNFLYDGKMILCCMDWTRETVYGDISKQTLYEITNSELYQSYLQKVNGEVKSEENFICKRCELAIP